MKPSDNSIQKNTEETDNSETENNAITSKVKSETHDNTEEKTELHDEQMNTSLDDIHNVKKLAQNNDNAMIEARDPSLKKPRSTDSSGILNDSINNGAQDHDNYHQYTEGLEGTGDENHENYSSEDVSESDKEMSDIEQDTEKAHDVENNISSVEQSINIDPELLALMNAQIQSQENNPGANEHLHTYSNQEPVYDMESEESSYETDISDSDESAEQYRYETASGQQSNAISTSSFNAEGHELIEISDSSDDEKIDDQPNQRPSIDTSKTELLSEAGDPDSGQYEKKQAESESDHEPFSESDQDKESQFDQDESNHENLNKYGAKDYSNENSRSVNFDQDVSNDEHDHEIPKEASDSNSGTNRSFDEHELEQQDDSKSGNASDYENQEAEPDNLEGVSDHDEIENSYRSSSQSDGHMDLDERSSADDDEDKSIQQVARSLIGQAIDDSFHRSQSDDDDESILNAIDESINDTMRNIASSFDNIIDRIVEPPSTEKHSDEHQGDNFASDTGDMNSEASDNEVSAVYFDAISQINELSNSDIPERKNDETEEEDDDTEFFDAESFETASQKEFDEYQNLDQEEDKTFEAETEGSSVKNSSDSARVSTSILSSNIDIDEDILQQNSAPDESDSELHENNSIPNESDDPDENKDSGDKIQDVEQSEASSRSQSLLSTSNNGDLVRASDHLHEVDSESENKAHILSPANVETDSQMENEELTKEILGGTDGGESKEEPIETGIQKDDETEGSLINTHEPGMDDDMELDDMESISKLHSSKYGDSEAATNIAIEDSNETEDQPMGEVENSTENFELVSKEKSPIESNGDEMDIDELEIGDPIEEEEPEPQNEREEGELETQDEREEEEHKILDTMEEDEPEDELIDDEKSSQNDSGDQVNHSSRDSSSSIELIDEETYNNDISFVKKDSEHKTGNDSDHDKETKSFEATSETDDKDDIDISLDKNNILEDFAQDDTTDNFVSLNNESENVKSPVLGEKVTSPIIEQNTDGDKPQLDMSAVNSENETAEEKIPQSPFHDESKNLASEENENQHEETSSYKSDAEGIEDSRLQISSLVAESDEQSFEDDPQFQNSVVHSDDKDLEQPESQPASLIESQNSSIVENTAQSKSNTSEPDENSESPSVMVYDERAEDKIKDDESKQSSIIEDDDVQLIGEPTISDETEDKKNDTSDEDDNENDQEDDDVKSIHSDQVDEDLKSQDTQTKVKINENQSIEVNEDANESFNKNQDEGVELIEINRIADHNTSGHAAQSHIQSAQLVSSQERVHAEVSSSEIDSNTVINQQAAPSNVFEQKSVQVLQSSMVQSSSENVAMGSVNTAQVTEVNTVNYNQIYTESNQVGLTQYSQPQVYSEIPPAMSLNAQPPNAIQQYQSQQPVAQVPHQSMIQNQPVHNPYEQQSQQQQLYPQYSQLPQSQYSIPQPEYQYQQQTSSQFQQYQYGQPSQQVRPSFNIQQAQQMQNYQQYAQQQQYEQAQMQNYQQPQAYQPINVQHQEQREVPSWNFESPPVENQSINADSLQQPNVEYPSTPSHPEMSSQPATPINPEEDEQEEVEEVIATPPPKTRGRKPKRGSSRGRRTSRRRGQSSIPTTTSEQPEAPSTPSKDQPVKRKRGRPRKNQ